jgi:lipopolysaccharide heptosyltransferase I
MPRRIAILKPSALGDICHALPVLTALREHFPDSHITWIVNRGFEPLLTGHPDLSETLPFDRGAFKRGPLEAARYTLRFGNALRRRRFDLVVDLQGLLRTGLMCGFTGSARRVGFANAREGARHFYTTAVDVPDADRIHAVDRYWRVAEALGIAGRPKRFVVPVRADELAAVDRDLADLPRPWVAVAAGAKWLTKRWPPASFAAVLNRASAEFGASAVLLGSPDDIALSHEIAGLVRGPVADLTGKSSLPRLSAVLARSDVMFANDTGPLHLAAALGRPCVAPYTCTKVALHGPYVVPGAGVETAVPCGGSYVRQCPNGLVCFPDLTPDRVWPPLAEVLSSWPRRSRSA